MSGTLEYEVLDRVLIDRYRPERGARPQPLRTEVVVPYRKGNRKAG